MKWSLHCARFSAGAQTAFVHGPRAVLWSCGQLAQLDLHENSRSPEKGLAASKLPSLVSWTEPATVQGQTVPGAMLKIQLIMGYPEIHAFFGLLVC